MAYTKHGTISGDDGKCHEQAAEKLLADIAAKSLKPGRISNQFDF
jgi:hypothetical protein